MHKKVFIIIVTHNGERWLSRLLESINQSTYPVKILIIDNDSIDHSVAIIKLFPNVQLIQSKENLGFGKANNVAIRKALEQEADYVFLLNQDTWVFPETVSSLVLASEQTNNCGIMSPLHFSGDEVTLDKNFAIYWEKNPKAISDTIDEIPFVNAAAWMIPKAIINKVGYFEPIFNHYGEDRNYVYRAQFHKFKMLIAKNSKICHDRIVKRDFKKDAVQSRFKILAEVLNVNNSLFVSYLKGFHNVLGLPKYFFKDYSFFKVIKLFFILLVYFIHLKLNVFKIYKTRLGYK